MYFHEPEYLNKTSIFWGCLNALWRYCNEGPLFTSCLSVQLISTSWFQAISWVVSMIFSLWYHRLHSFGWFLKTSNNSNNFHTVSMWFYWISNPNPNTKSITEVSTDFRRFYVISYDFLWLHLWFRTDEFNDFTDKWQCNI